MASKRLSEGFGAAAYRDVGTVPGTVADGGDPRIVRGGTALQPTGDISRTVGVNADIIEKIAETPGSTLAQSYAPVKTVFVGDGVTTSFRLLGTPSLANPVAYQVFINGIAQEPVDSTRLDAYGQIIDPNGAYTIANGYINFTDPIPNGFTGWVISQRTLIQSVPAAAVYAYNDVSQAAQTGWKNGDIITQVGATQATTHYYLVVDSTALTHGTMTGLLELGFSPQPVYYTPDGRRVTFVFSDDLVATPKLV